MIAATSLSEISAALNAQLLGSDAEFSAVSIDTRSLESGALYLALKGPNFDGHSFVGQAMERGAVAAVVSETVASEVPQLLVADTRQALGELGAFNRKRFDGRVLAITGSAGKTTVKEMAAAILQQSATVFASSGNFNNEIGVPLMLLEICKRHEMAVMELGASAIGEIARTVAMAQPDVAILTKAAPAHIEGFGSLENVVQAKGEIIDGLGPQGTIVLNQDDPNVARWIERAGSRPIVLFSLDEASDADFRARNCVADPTGAYSFEMITPIGTVDINLAQLGKHNVANALAAAAGAIALGASLADVKGGLEISTAVAGRLVGRPGINGATVLDDTYNSNPESLRAASDVLAGFAGKRLLVMGDMAELGDEAPRHHLESARYAIEQDIEEVWGVGSLSKAAVSQLGERGRGFSSKEALIEALVSELTEDTTVLVKGSRSARMEEVVSAISSGEQ